MTPEQFKRLNQRRHELIIRNMDGTATPKEKVVLDRLQKIVSEYASRGESLRPLELVCWEARQMLRQMYPKGTKYPKHEQVQELGKKGA